MPLSTLTFCPSFMYTYSHHLLSFCFICCYCFIFSSPLGFFPLFSPPLVCCHSLHPSFFSPFTTILSFFTSLFSLFFIYFFVIFFIPSLFQLHIFSPSSVFIMPCALHPFLIQSPIAPSIAPHYFPFFLSFVFLLLPLFLSISCSVTSVNVCMHAHMFR